jgi:hypothetical protein
MSFETTLIVSAIAGLIPAWVAHEKGRSFGAWWLYGAAFWLFAMIHAASLKKGVPALRIIEVPACSKGAQAGLLAGDCIVRLDGTLICAMERFRAAMKSGDSHTLTVLRAFHSLEIPTGQGPLGITLREWYAPEHGIPVLRITKVARRSKASKAGLQTGDLIMWRNGTAVFPVPDELSRAMWTTKQNTLSIRRGAEELHIEVGKGPIGIRTERAELVTVPSATAIGGASAAS